IFFHNFWTLKSFSMDFLVYKAFSANKYSLEMIKHMAGRRPHRIRAGRTRSGRVGRSVAAPASQERAPWLAGRLGRRRRRRGAAVAGKTGRGWGEDGQPPQ